MNRWNLENLNLEPCKFARGYDFCAKHLQQIEDPVRAAGFIDKEERDIFIENNIDSLAASGKLENIIIDLYVMLELPLYKLGIEVWAYLFDRCDRGRLLAEGDELPKELGSEFTIYRGQNLDEDPGISWTLSKEKAAWFASVRNMKGLVKNGKTGVIDMRVTIDDILFYTNERQEQEVVISPYIHHGYIL